jgi:hypothetical protein
MDNSRIFREEQIWNRVFIPHKNAIRVITDSVTTRDCILIQINPVDVGQEIELTIPKEVVSYSMKVRGNARLKISPNQGDIANSVYFSLGPHGIFIEKNLSSENDFKLFFEIDKERDIEIFLWKGNFQSA